MKLILCLDDKNGMLFHMRRQSADKALCRKMLELAEGKTLWMHPYSRLLFTGLDGRIKAAGACMELAQPDDYCFVENIDVTPFLPVVQELIIFRWNRIYPADLRFPGVPAELKVVRSEDFVGNSHDRITMEVYKR